MSVSIFTFFPHPPWSFASVTPSLAVLTAPPDTDTVTLASGLIITSQSIGVASSSAGFDGVDGILGIGPVDLTSGTVSDTDAVPTVMDNLLSQGTISSEVIGVYYAPAAGSDSSGEITFGGADSGKYTGDIAYADVTATSPASEYWGVDQAVSYGGSEILSSTSGIVGESPEFSAP